MAFPRGVLKSVLLLLAGQPIAGTAEAIAGEQPTVVELFTSQGCSSCPPANANLALLSERPGVLALSFGVTYWDYLGWKDTFARPEFTDRQIAYEPRLGETGPFTPQIVIDGRADTVGNRLGSVETLVAASARPRGPNIRIDGASVSIGAATAPKDGADIWLVRYDPRRVDIPVGRGENGGRTLPHKNVVHALIRIGTWSGGEVALTFPPAEDGQRSAVLVQEPHGGPILAAATN
jgi:hypothetical protein